MGQSPTGYMPAPMPSQLQLSQLNALNAPSAAITTQSSEYESPYFSRITFTRTSGRPLWLVSIMNGL